MPDTHWAEKPNLVTTILMSEDTAGNQYYAEFDGGTAPIRTWIKPARASRYTIKTDPQEFSFEDWKHQ